MSQWKMGSVIAAKRKALGLTQLELAQRLGVTFQAVSKWETEQTCPDIELLPRLAGALSTSTDALLGYRAEAITEYERKYEDASFYWGLQPNELCYEIMRRKPPAERCRVLDVGCGEGKDAVFLARNGYQVTAFDAAESGVEKARRLALQSGVRMDVFRADINDYRLQGEYDVIFSSGVLHYLLPEARASFLESLKAHTGAGGLHVLNVFVPKPFLNPPPDQEESEKHLPPWRSGELFTHYTDWMLERAEEVIFDCTSGGIPHRHCMDILIARKV